MLNDRISNWIGNGAASETDVCRVCDCGDSFAHFIIPSSVSYEIVSRLLFAHNWCVCVQFRCHSIVRYVNQLLTYSICRANCLYLHFARFKRSSQGERPAPYMHLDQLPYANKQNRSDVFDASVRDRQIVIDFASTGMVTCCSHFDFKAKDVCQGINRRERTLSPLYFSEAEDQSVCNVIHKCKQKMTYDICQQTTVSSWLNQLRVPAMADVIRYRHTHACMHTHHLTAAFADTFRCGYTQVLFHILNCIPRIPAIFLDICALRSRILLAQLRTRQMQQS